MEDYLKIVWFFCVLHVSYSFYGSINLKTSRLSARMSAKDSDQPLAHIDTNPSSMNFKGIIAKCIKPAITIGYSALLSTAFASTAVSEEVPTGSIAVVGASGKTGKLIVEGLAKGGFNVRPIYREVPSNNLYSGFANVESPIAADVVVPASLESALKGANVAIFAASASSKGGNAEKVDYLGVKNIAEVAIKLKIPRLIVISSGAITKPDSFGFKFTNVFGRIMEFKLLGEQAVYEAYKDTPSLGYIIIRPGGLKDGSPVGAGNLVLNQGDTILGEINRSDVANVAIAAAISKTIPNNVVFEVYESNGGGPLEGRFPKVSGYERDGKVLGNNFEDLFAGLKPGVNGL